jgi:hypothetical protein
LPQRILKENLSNFYQTNFLYIKILDLGVWKQWKTELAQEQHNKDIEIGAKGRERVLTETLVEGFVPMDEGCVYMR